MVRAAGPAGLRLRSVDVLPRWLPRRMSSRVCLPYTRCSWGHSSAGRAPALQAGGRRFDPGWLHWRKCLQIGWFWVAAWYLAGTRC